MKKFLIILGVLLVAVLGGGMLMPAEVVVERTNQINAPADIVFSQINNLKAWEAWDPWHAKQPEMGGSVYSGPEEGPGATHCWDSDHPEIGKGCMAISESEASSYIKTDLVFDGRDSAHGGFNLNESEGVTTVIWRMEVNMGMTPWGRIFGLFFDRMIGPDFEYGLATLKEVCEAMPAEEAKEYPIEISYTSIDEQPIYSIKDSATTFEIGEKFGQMYGEIMVHLASTGGEAAGQPFAIWHNYDPGGYNHIEAGIPASETVEGTGRVKEGFIEAGNAVMGIHKGAYEDAAVSYDAIKEYIADNGYQQVGPPWETYVTDPVSIPDTADWVTHIFFRVEPQ